MREVTKQLEISGNTVLSWPTFTSEEMLLGYKADEKKTVELIGVDSDLKRREEIIQLISHLEKEKDEIDKKVQQQLLKSNAVYGESENYFVSWIFLESKRLNTKALKMDFPEVYEKYSTTNTSRRYTIKQVA